MSCKQLARNNKKTWGGSWRMDPKGEILPSRWHNSGSPRPRKALPPVYHQVHLEFHPSPHRILLPHPMGSGDHEVAKTLTNQEVSEWAASSSCRCWKLPQWIHVLPGDLQCQPLEGGRSDQRLMSGSDGAKRHHQNQSQSSFSTAGKWSGHFSSKYLLAQMTERTQANSSHANSKEEVWVSQMKARSFEPVTYSQRPCSLPRHFQPLPPFPADSAWALSYL